MIITVRIVFVFRHTGRRCGGSGVAVPTVQAMIITVRVVFSFTPVCGCGGSGVAVPTVPAMIITVRIVLFPSHRLRLRRFRRCGSDGAGHDHHGENRFFRHTGRRCGCSGVAVPTVPAMITVKVVLIIQCNTFYTGGTSPTSGVFSNVLGVDSGFGRDRRCSWGGNRRCSWGGVDSGFVRDFSERL